MSNPELLILVGRVFLVYGVTLLICTSSIMDPFRQALILKTPWLYSPFASLFKDYQFKGDEKHFIECRMCVGFPITLLCCIYYSDYTNFFTIYSSAYFLASQER